MAQLPQPPASQPTPQMPPQAVPSPSSVFAKQEKINHDWNKSNNSFRTPGYPTTIRAALFCGLAISIVLLVFVGFSRTYYLHTFFKTPKLTIFLHIHAAVMTGWIALFAVQTFLVASNQMRTHRVLGTFGAGYAALVVVMGCTATVLSARREVRAHSAFVSGFLTVLALELTQMVLFASLVTLGVWLRNRPAYHKRLMLLATFCILPNPIVRLFIWAGIGSNIMILSVWALLVFAVVLLDSMRSRRLHPAFGLGATITVAFLYFAYFGSHTSLWQHFAANAVG